MARLGRHLDREDFTPEVQRVIGALDLLDDEIRERVCATAMGRARLRDWSRDKKEDETKYDHPRRFPGDDHVDAWKDYESCYHVSQPYDLSTNEIVGLAELIKAEGIDVTISAQGSWYNPGRTLNITLKRRLCSRPWGPSDEVGPPTSLEIMGQAIKESK
jgi:hypothetical protein